MSGNPVNEYLSGLRNASEQLGQQKICTLAVQFHDTLSQLPAFKAEIDYMLSQGAGLDYGALAMKLEPALNKAASLIWDVSRLPVSIRTTQAMCEFEEMLRKKLKVQTVNLLTEEFAALCNQINREITQEQQRKEEEAEKSEWLAKEAEREGREKARLILEMKEQERAKYERSLVYRNMVENDYVLIKGSSGINDFFMARYEVTNEQYRIFINYLQSSTPELESRYSLLRFKEKIEGRCFLWVEKNSLRLYLNGEPDIVERFSGLEGKKKSGFGDHPVVGVCWYDASIYCLWLSLIESKGETDYLFRLPTKDEWQWAAAGKERRRYPWGNQEPDSTRTNFNSKEDFYLRRTGLEYFPSTTTVRCYPKGATPDGVYDLAGNVNELCDSWYEFDLRGAYGGCWNDDAVRLKCFSNPLVTSPSRKSVRTGFRVIRSKYP